MKYIEKNDIKLPYQIEIKAIKHTYFKVRKDHIHISTSKYTSHKVIINYLMLHFDRLSQKLHQVSQALTDQTIMLWGKSYHIIIHKGKFTYTLDQDQVHVWYPSDDLEAIRKMIYLKEMQTILPSVEKEIYPVIATDGLTIKPVRIKYLRSKFGSYHRKKDEITINAFLASLPIELLKYVMYHEYAHILVFNHSQSFYNQLAKWLPNHKRYQKTLKNIAIY